MELLIDAIANFHLLLTPLALAAAMLGTIVGIIFGAIPGIGAPVVMTVFLPLAFALGTIPSLMLMLAIYCASLYGGSISSILINVPGHPAAVAATFDGYAMSKKGEAAKALNAAAVSSLIGGTFSLIVFIAFFMPMNTLFIRFGPSQMFMFVLVSFIYLSSLGTGDWGKSAIATCVGLLLGLVGLDLMSGAVRFTFGYVFIEDGLDVIAVLTGWFAITEVIALVGERGGTIAAGGKLKGSPIDGIKACFKYPVTLLRSSIMGSLIGVVPGVGGAVANIAAYNAAKKASKTPEVFGTGHPEGIVAPESANNAVTATSLIPTLALGIPGSAPAAIIMGVLLMLGHNPGPGMATGDSIIIPAVVGGLFIVNIMFCVVGISMTGLYKKITQVNLNILIPMIISVSLLGGFLSRFRLSDMLIALALGVFAYGAKRANYPPTPMVLGFLLAKMLEENFFRSMMISGQDISIFFTGTINLSLIAMGVFIIVFEPLKTLIRKRTASKSSQ